MIPHWLLQGGWTLFPLLVGSIVGWTIAFERGWFYRRISKELREGQLELSNALLRQDPNYLNNTLARLSFLPTARVLQTGLKRLESTESLLREGYLQAMERDRQSWNQELKRPLWILGTIGSSAPFVGLAGTVVGILQAFQSISEKGSGGFTVVAGAISEALIATAAGIVVAVVAVISFNALQSKAAQLILQTKLNLEELVELLRVSRKGSNP